MIRISWCVVLLPGCGGEEDEHGHGHGRGEEAEDPRPGFAVTHYTERTELFVEYPSLVVGRDSKFAAHLTRIPDFTPVETGRCVVVLSGGGAAEERFAVDAPRVPGIFGPVARPASAGTRRLSVLLDGGNPDDAHDLGEVVVHASVQAAALAAPPEDEAAGAIPYLKEQQWRTEYATAAVGVRPLRASVVANGTLRALPEGEARISAPVAGRLLTAGADFPRIGLEVAEDAVLSVLAPRLDSATDSASLQLEVAQAGLDLERARRERERLEGLLAAQAVPERRVADARSEEAGAEAALQAARQRIGQYFGTQRAGGRGAGGRVAVRSPIAGVVARVDTTPGAFVEEGDPLFHVVDLDRLWLEAQIPEADIARARGATGAWFEVEGFERPFDVGSETGGRVVALGGVVDPDTRTAPLVFELANPDRALRVGMFARVRVLTGESRTALAVPQTAVVDDGGQEVVFVMLGGESFARRPVRLGVRDGDFVEVLEGLTSGERVVSRGAWQVRLAAAGGAVPAHGHVH